MKAILDADSFVFRAAIASELDELYIAMERVDKMINTALDEVGANESHIVLSGRNNFRYLAYPEYKGNRSGKEDPKWRQALKQHLLDHWQAEVYDGIEGDDACGIAQCTARKDSTIIIHQDKDIDQIPGWHYNFVTKEKYYVTPEEALRFFYYQLIVGDTADNIKGIKGLGKVKAKKLLDSTHPANYHEAIRDLYGSDEEMDMNATCVYIWRKQNDTWRNLIETSVS